PASRPTAIYTLSLPTLFRSQRAEHQMTGLGGGERQADGLQVAHLADQDHIRILAQRRAQRLAEAERVAMHLALVDETALGVVHEDRKSTRLNSSHLVISYAV